MTSGELVSALRLDFTDRARDDVQELVRWLFTLSEEAAARFSAVLDAELPALCQRAAEHLANKHKPAPLDETGSAAFSKPVYRLTITTQKKRKRRSAAGTYFVYYELLDAAGGSGKPDTLRVLAVVHAATAPLTQWLDENADILPDP